ncbi:hypothetical protein AG1IA_05711 [Rhizoctonia solani AG-1 IA]|uniref:Uncharacterized protein n=1 Tax=Thanatephorus cucumeris (strain AG1-IA) TaxID=983506 RepID=L8WVA0_THACA|nr:hypothetical protein AG1IA_05711 [Rhizoctonia solani AG-1 IA]
MRSFSVDVYSHSRQQSTDTTTPSHHPQSQQSRRPSVDVLSHARRPSGFEVISRPKSPGPAAAVEPRPVQQTKTTDQLRMEAIEAMRGGQLVGPGMERAKSPAPSLASRLHEAFGPVQAQDAQAQAQAQVQVQAQTEVQDTQATPRKNYVPPPRQSSLAAGALFDSDSDESPEEVESESEGLGFGKAGKVGAMRGRHGQGKDARPSIGHGLAGSPPARGNRSTTTTAASGGSTDPLVSNSAASPSSTPITRGPIQMTSRA